jgi:hypothetical protein
VCEDGLFIPGFVVHHAHGEKMERVKDTILYVLDTVHYVSLPAVNVPTNKTGDFATYKYSLLIILS